MKSNGYSGSITLSNLDNESVEKDLNKINEEDEVLSVSDEGDLNTTDSDGKLKQKKGHLTEKKLRELCSSVEKLITSTNWESVKSTIENVKTEIESLDPDKKYEDIHIKFNEYYIVFERRYNNHLMVKKAIDLKEQLCRELENLVKTEECSTLKETYNLIKEQWLKSESVPERFEEVLERKYKELARNIDEKIEKIKETVEENLSIEKLLETCCEKAEEIINSENFNKASEKLKHIENEWNMLIEKATDFDTLSERFSGIINTFNNKKEHYSLELEKNKEEVLQKVNQIIDEIEKCLSDDNIKSILHKVKDLQKEWELLENNLIDETESKKFNKLIKKYFSKLKYIQQKEDWGRWENYTNKLLLCERAEKLLEEEDSFKLAKEIKIIWDEWRAIGQAPREKNDEIWDRFNKTRQLLKTRCNDFFKNLKEERGDNTERKIKLCEKAEELSSSTDWEATAEELKNIQYEWKGIGPAEKVIDDELFSRFRNACNKFFESRIEFYKRLHQKQAVNKKEKKYLIDEAEKLSELNWKEAVKKIRKLRSDWKKTGTASRQEEQKLWGRFNSVIENYLAELDTAKPENLRKKEDICSRIEEIITQIDQTGERQSDNDDKIEKLKLDWKTIGPVPKEVEKEIEEKYETLKDKLAVVYQKMLESKAEKNTMSLMKKEEILVKIEELALDGKFEEKLDEFNKICEKWHSMAIELSAEATQKLNLRFDELCNAFNNKDQVFFDSIKENKKQNLKKKIKICVELEKLADISTPADLLSGGSTSNLADELMFAIRGNFASDNNNHSDTVNIREKYRKFQDEWNSTGVVPLDEYESINLRYNRVCSNIEANLR